MSSTNTDSSVSNEVASRNNLIDKVLYRGHRLRNAMVQSILDHDPFNTEIFNEYNTNSLLTSRLRKRIPSQCTNSETNLLDFEKRKLKTFLKGEFMKKQEQIEALETLRSMSSENILKTTDEAYKSNCECTTCLHYGEGDLNCDLKRFKESCCSNKDRLGNDKTPPKTQEENYINEYLKYVDCLQVSVHDLILNDKGNKKVNSYVSADKKILPWGSHTFFIEYELPFILSVSNSGKKVKKTITSVSNNNFVRICARRTSNGAIHFKHTSVHNINNMDKISLGGIKLKFQITCRMMKQKSVIPIGYVLFNFSKFESSPTFTCMEDLSVNFDDTVPIVLGSLRVTLKMGYGKLYYGNEFIACFEGAEKKSQKSEVNSDGHQVSNTPSFKTLSKEKGATEKVAPKLISEEKIEDSVKLGFNRPNIGVLALQETKTILFGFIYIPEAQYTKADINSFITCRPFCQEENCYSEPVWNESKPIFNFSQLVPLIYDEGLLQKFRDNFMVIEFWEKFETKNILLGLSKLPLNQFYLAYRNKDITKYLLCNELPVISSDWWEAITNPYTDEFVGQVQVLLALGTEKQIHNLQLERGFKTNSVQANFQTPLEKNKRIIISKGRNNLEKTKLISNKKDIQTATAEKINFKGSIGTALNKSIERNTKDQCVQFDFEMDSEIPSKEKVVESNEKLEQILSHLIAMRNQQEGVKNIGTNTDDENKSMNNESVRKEDDFVKGQKDSSAIPDVPNFDMLNSNQQYQNMPPLVRSTSELLNTLQAALSVSPPMRRSPVNSQQAAAYQTKMYKKNPTSFKVHIAINQAMHLPIRKKCKAKRNKGKSVKMEDNAKPSCYVTFETMPGLDLKMTPLVQKSTNPEWKYECDVILPSDLLTNNKKRLILKVWRKSTNTNMIPNLQTDSIIGFAAVDLSVLLSGLPNIKGWFNIIDLTSKCNGQINIHVTPLEDMAVFRSHRDTSLSCHTSTLDREVHKESTPIISNTPQVELNNQEDEEDGELLSRALKRKFAELDEITQRLRLRLSHVTNEDTEEEENDEFAEQFERDINTLSIEEDFDMINFEQDSVQNPQECNLLKIECSSESSLDHASVQNALRISTEEGHVDQEVEESLSVLDRQLLIGKHRIDTLLGKLSLISGDMNSSRYVSGCSGSNYEEPRNIDTEAILKDLNRNSRPNINGCTSYDKAMFQQIYEYKDTESYTDSNLSSSTSVISNLEESRPAPDGEGNLSEDRSKVKNV